MRSVNKTMMFKKYYAITAISILCIAGVLMAGCSGTNQTPVTEKTQRPTPSGTAVQEGHIVITEQQNNTTVPVDQGNTVTLMLPENPTTGFEWNLTTTPGLNVTRDLFVPSDKTGTLVGSGGTRIWEIAVTGTGTQEISGIYKRSWEPVTGNETSFGVTLTVR